MKRKCFIIGPIDQEESKIREEADKLFEEIIAPVMEMCNFEAYRSDHLDEPGQITEQVYQHIKSASLCIADLTNHNSNVFYELAFADTLDKPVIIIYKKGQVLPFDLKDRRCIEYDLEDEIDKEEYIKKVEGFKNKILKYIESYKERNWDGLGLFKDFIAPIVQIESREQLYYKAIDMIKRANCIRDTTWGKISRHLDPKEKIAREKYRKCSNEAIVNGVIYLDLFSKSKKHESDAKSLYKKFIKYTKYEVRILQEMDEHLPVIDFLVTDKEEILLSHVGFEGTRYLFIKSKIIAEFYIELFDECWKIAKKVIMPSEK